MADSKKPKIETKPVPVQEPWTDRERALLEPEIAELVAAKVEYDKSLARLQRLASALNPGAVLDIDHRCWTKPAKPSAEKRSAERDAALT